MSNTKHTSAREILEDLAESYYPEHEYNDMWRDRNAGLVQEALAQLLALLEGELIGEDEDEVFWNGEEELASQTVVDRNELRDEQRDRLKKLMGGE